MKNVVFGGAHPSVSHPFCDVYSAKAYVDEINAYLAANDGWNAAGNLGGREANLVPFSDFTMEDSEGNKWDGYTPENTPYEARKCNRAKLVYGRCQGAPVRGGVLVEKTSALQNATYYYGL